MPSDAIEVLKGTLDMMVLSILDEGSMYPALYRMQKRGLIKAEWSRTDSNRRAKIYSLTQDGRGQLTRETAYWERFSEAVGRVMGRPPEEIR